MNIVDYIAIAVVVLTVGAAAFYIIRAKRRGQKCIGCPYAGQCAGNGKSDCGCRNGESSGGKKGES